LAGRVESGPAVAARAWCRADLAGGTLDIWPLGLLHPGARTVNVALDLAVEVEMSLTESLYRIHQGGSLVEARTAAELAATEEGALIGLIAAELNLPPVEVRVQSASPRGGGLGASSALTVAVIAAGEVVCGGGESPVEARAALARDLEAQLMSLPTGRQDHFAALLGGVLEIRHQPGGEQVRRLEIDPGHLKESLLVVYTGQSHFSAGHNWRIIRRRLEADSTTIRCFDGIRDAAQGIVDALERADLARAGELMGEEWSWRRRLAEGVSTPKIEELLEAASDAGAWGGKACGAGGGGCIVLLCPPAVRSDVERAVAERGGQVLDTDPASGSLSVTTMGSLVG